MGTVLNPPSHRDPWESDGDAARQRSASLAKVPFLAIVLVVSVTAGLTIYRSGEMTGSIWVAAAMAVLVLVASAIPILMLGRGIERRKSLAALTERVRGVTLGELGKPITGDFRGAEVGELARVFEEWRTDLMNHREAFEHQKAALAQVLDGIGEGLVAINRQKRVVLANRRLSDLFGIEGPLIGKSFLEVIRSQSLMAAFDRALDGAESTDRATMQVKGFTRQIEMRVFPISTASEIAAVALFIDVTRIEQLETVRRDFIADFSHEVRTPLAGIRSAVDTFDAGGLEPAQEEHLKRIIARQVNRLEKLVEEVGELKQIEAGEMQLIMEPVRLRRLLEDLADDFSESAANREVRIVVGEGDATVLADVQKIQQVFANLIDNALKHGGKGGQVRLEISTENATARIRVIDFGDGIPVEEQERIFNRLYRIDRSRSQEVKGNGLGLAITKHLVHLHGGSIRVDSEPGRGAIFEVRLPAV